MNKQSSLPVPKAGIDKAVFFPALIVTLIMGTIFIFQPEASRDILGKIHKFTTNELGWFFLITTFSCVVFCVYMGISKYGGIVLGRKGEKPAFKTLTWLGMIFTSGTGGSVLYLGSIEWVWIMQSPPFGLEAGSQDAARWASAYGMFHWGPSAWAWYIVCAVSIAYFFFIRREQTLKMSEFTRPVLGKQADKTLGHLVNFLYMFGILGGVMTSLALGTPVISNTFSFIFGLEPNNPYMDTFVIFLWTFIPLMALILGLQKGVGILSNWNIRFDIVLLLSIVILGPTAFILNQAVDGLGLMLQNFIYMSFVTDVIGNGKFPQSWTVFYFSWWVVYALPFGLFIARISRGRTIRQLVTGGLLAGSLGCMVFYMVLSSMGINYQLTGKADLMSILDTQGRGEVVLEMLRHLPAGSVFALAFGIITLISYITGHCAVGYSLAAATQKRISQNEDPIHWNIAFWLVLAGCVSLGLYFLNPKSLGPLQTVSILVGFPLCFVIYTVVYSFLKQLKKDFPILPAPNEEGKIYLSFNSEAEDQDLDDDAKQRIVIDKPKAKKQPKKA